MIVSGLNSKIANLFINERRNRFVGMASFTENDFDIFFGRDEDIENLCTLVQIEKMVVLFSKSGLGKTSLLKAGVEPTLRKKNYEPLRVRFFNYAGTQDEYVSPTQVLENALGEWKEGTFLDTLIPSTYRNTIWAKLKNFQVREPHKTFLFLMDQFEELSTHPQEEIIWFKYQLADILQTKLPKIIEQNLHNQLQITTEQMALLYAPIPVRVIISMRADYLSFLQQFRDAIPFILNKTYELSPLNVYSAKEALLKPAQKTGVDFSTPPFRIAEGAFDKIVQELTVGSTIQTTKTVESFQLQMVGSEIERIVIEKRKQNADYQEVILQDLPDLQNLWGEFYNKAITSLPTEAQPQAQKLIEEYLVQKGRRISLDEVICLQVLPNPEALKVLVDNRLLRMEANNRQGVSYEVSHDTMIKPIVEKFEKRQEIEREKLLKAQIAQERKERQMKEKEAIRNKWLFYMAATALCLSLLTGAISIYFYRLFVQERNAKERNMERARRELEIRHKKTEDSLKASETIIDYFQKEIEKPTPPNPVGGGGGDDLVHFVPKSAEILRKELLQQVRKFELLGDSYVKLGKIESACKHFNVALRKLQAYPESTEYKRIVEKIKRCR
jgi:hypothetical protein